MFGFMTVVVAMPYEGGRRMVAGGRRGGARGVFGRWEGSGRMRDCYGVQWRRDCCQWGSWVLSKGGAMGGRVLSGVKQFLVILRRSGIWVLMRGCRG